MMSEDLKTAGVELTQDCISRHGAIDAIRAMQTYKLFAGDDLILVDQAGAQAELMMLPPAEPQVLTCDGCRHVGTYDTDFPCSMCIRREKDYYAPERRTDENNNQI